MRERLNRERKMLDRPNSAQSNTYFDRFRDFTLTSNSTQLLRSFVLFTVVIVYSLQTPLTPYRFTNVSLHNVTFLHPTRRKFHFIGDF